MAAFQQDREQKVRMKLSMINLLMSTANKMQKNPN